MNREHPGRGRLLMAMAILGLAPGGCEDRSRAAPRAANLPSSATVEAAHAGSLERAQVLGPFLAPHWKLPVPPQGPP